ncbi:hypothetical protein BC629DRAFT_780969 [Irpex lacteus]|nr:hypothetical protein BC629DRAFT_780969 [Irpex lacteus]
MDPIMEYAHLSPSLQIPHNAATFQFTPQQTYLLPPIHRQDRSPNDVSTSLPGQASLPGPSSESANNGGTQLPRPARPPLRYTCTVCGKAFARPSSLKTHSYKHSGIKPYKCPFAGCARAFSVKSNMKRHLATHRQSRLSQISPPTFEDTVTHPSSQSSSLTSFPLLAPGAFAQQPNSHVP